MRRKHPWLSVVLWTCLSFVTLFPIYWLFVISMVQRHIVAGLTFGAVKG